MRNLFFVISAVAVLTVAAGGTAWAVLEQVGVSDSSAIAPAISGDGRYIVFQSSSAHIVPGDRNTCLDYGSCNDVFLYDRLTNSTTRESVTSLGEEAESDPHSTSAGGSGSPAMSQDARFIVFNSDALNLVPNDTNDKIDVFLRDRSLGSTERVSLTNSGGEANGHSTYAHVSDDGRYVSFDSQATNLTADVTTNRETYLRDRLLETTTMISTDSGGIPADSESFASYITRNGAYASFVSRADNLVPNDTNNTTDVFLKDLTTGAISIVSTDSDGVIGNAGSDCTPVVSDDGRYVAFASSANNLVPDDTNGVNDVFLKDMQTGAIQRVSLDSSGNEASVQSGGNVVSISSDGSLVAFGSSATLVPGTKSLCGEVGSLYPCEDLFVRDISANGIVALSAVDGMYGNGNSSVPSLSPDGTYAVFGTEATNLTPAPSRTRAVVSTTQLAFKRSAQRPRDKGRYLVQNPCVPGQTVCSDGVVEYGCEQCDDGNLVSGDGCSSSCEREFFSGRRLFLSKTGRFSFVSRDKALGVGGGNGSSDDPVLAGADIRLLDGNGGEFAATLPAAGWSYIGKAGDNKGYRYKDDLLRVRLRPGRVLKIRGTGSTLSLALNLKPVVVTLSMGNRYFCSKFGGTSKFVTNEKFTAHDAPAVEVCP